MLNQYCPVELRINSVDYENVGLSNRLDARNSLFQWQFLEERQRQDL